MKSGYNGYAVVPNAQPYRVNWATLDTRNLGSDIELENATQQVVPCHGAGASKKGRRVQFELLAPQGTPMVFGASLETQDGKQLAISAPNGHALALMEAESGTPVVKWESQQCMAEYSLPPQDTTRNFERYRLNCRP